MGHNVTHSLGVLELRLSDLDWIGQPGSIISSVSLTSFTKDYEWWNPSNTLTWGTDNIYLKFGGIADNDIYNFQIDFSETSNEVPEPTTMLLLGLGLIGLAGVRKKFYK